MDSTFCALRYRGIRWMVERASAEGFAHSYAPFLGVLGGVCGEVEFLRQRSQQLVCRIPAPDGGNAHAYMKLFRRPRARYLFRASPGIREGNILMRLGKSGIPVPTIIALGRNGRLSPRCLSAVITHTEDRFVNFGEYLHERISREGLGNIPQHLQTLLALFRRLHDLGICHGDAHLGNFLFDPRKGEFLLIDFQRSPLFGSQSPFEQARDLSKIHLFFTQYFSKEEWLDLADQPYFRGEQERVRAIRDAWDSVLHTSLNAKCERAAHDAVSGRHHFRKDEADGCTVYFHREPGYSASQFARFAREGCSKDMMLLAEHQTRTTALRDWRERVRKAAHAPESVMPLALVIFPRKRGPKAVILGGQGIRATYSLDWIFSFERFARTPHASEKSAACSG